MTVSDKVYSLTHSQKTLTAAFAASPASSPGDLAKTLYAEHHKKPISSGGYVETFMGMLRSGNAHETQRIPPGGPTQADLDRAAECGDFGSRPSDLFLKVSEVWLPGRCVILTYFIKRSTVTCLLRSIRILGLVWYRPPCWVLEAS